MNTTLTPADLDPRRQAMLLYFQGYRVARIAEMLGEKVATVHSWKKRDKWGDYGPLDQMQLTTAARYCQLIMKEHKEGKDFKEIDLLARQSERHARIGKFNNGGNEADLNPNVANRNKGPRRQPEKNVFTDEQIEKLEEIFHSSMFNYQRHWWEAGKTNRIRNLLKSRQIGATFYFAREALIDALLTGRNQIFLSASKAQAHVFKQYIIDFAKEVEVELKGDPMVLPNGATLYFLGTNARTAQSYHGNLYLDEYFWIPKFQELRKVASGMAIHKKWRQTYFSTPSSLTHSAYPFWSGALFNRGRNKADKVDIDLSHSNLAPGLLCADGQYRQIVTVEDAVREGCEWIRQFAQIDAGRRRVYHCIATLLAMDDPNACEAALVSLYGDETLDMATDLIDGDLRFFALPSPGLDLAGCELHQRLLGEYAKVHAVAPA